MSRDAPSALFLREAWGEEGRRISVSSIPQQKLNKDFSLPLDMGNCHTVGPNEALIVSGRVISRLREILEIWGRTRDLCGSSAFAALQEFSVAVLCVKQYFSSCFQLIKAIF